MKTCLVSIVLFLATFSPFALPKPLLKFQQYGTKAGLPNQTIWDLAQDNDGLIWLATTRGLASFDGYTFQSFTNKNNSKNTRDLNSIRSIYADKNEGTPLFVGSYAGLAKLNLKSNNLESIEISLSNGTNLSEITIYDIEVSSNNKVWLGTSQGVVVLDNPSGKLAESTTFRHRLNVSTNIIFELEPNQFLLGSNDGLYVYNQQSDLLRKAIIPPDITTKLNVKAIFQSANKSILIGSNTGLFKFDLANVALKPFIDPLAGKFVFSIAEYNNELWVGTQNFGLYNVDNNGSVTNSRYSKDNPDGLPDHDVYSLLLDNSNTLWIGSFNGGVSKIRPETRSFQFFSDSESSLECLKSPVIYSIYEENDNIFWLGTQKGLARVQLEPSQCRLFDTQSDTKLSGIDVLSLFPDIDNPNYLHVGTRYGVDTIDLQRLNKVGVPSLKPVISAHDRIISPDNTIYLATYFGILKKEPGQNVFTPVESTEESLEKTISFKAAGVNGKIYFSSEKGLLTIDKDGQLERVEWTDSNHINQSIRAIAIDSKDRIWLGIDNNGLYCHDATGKLLYQWTDPKTLPAIRGFSSIAITESDELWIASTQGISHLTPSTKEIINYYQGDGLSNAAYTNGAYFKGDSGYHYFGSRQGLTRFKPDEIKKNTTPPNVVLTDFLYFNKSLKNEPNSDEFLIDRPLSKLRKLNLSYKDYVFGFEFAGLNYADPMRNQYAYKLENWDEDWNYTSADFRRANYSNLPAGDYTFMVKASNNHNVWNAAPLKVAVHVSPPPWATLWAYLIYATLIIASIYGFITYRTKSLKARSVELEKSVSQRTIELAEEKGKVEQLLSRKNEEFANVSHEFRTPLTLILGPIKQLLNQSKDKKDSHKLQLVRRNAYRLLRMVDQLLNLETFRVKAISRKVPQTIGKKINLIAEAFEDLAVEKNLKLEIGTIENVNFDFVPDGIEKIILNLLSNAVKYTKPGGTIAISAIRSGENYQIIVTDNGIGIPEDQLKTVFDRFKRVLDENSEQVTGAGIGMALVKSLVESHQGQISLTSELGKGTQATITLPIINEVEDDKVSNHASDEVIAMELMSLSSQEKSAVIADAVDVIPENNDKPTVLVIEDNSDMRQYIKDSLRDKYCILTAENGRLGFELALKEIPDLVISDIMMPVLDGYETTKRLRQDPLTSHIPIILLTARGDKESRLKGWYEKADEYVTKPFDIEELLIRLKNLLDIRVILKKRYGEILFQEPSPLKETRSQISSLQNEPDSDLIDNQQRLQDAFVDKLNSIIEKVYTNSELTISDIAKKNAMSERQLFRKLKSILDMTPSEYLRRYRLEQSKTILISGKSASYAAFEVGFSSQSYYGKCFKAQYGVSPKEYVNQRLRP